MLPLNFISHPEQLPHFGFHCAVLGVFEGIAEADVVLVDVYFIAESEDIAQADAVNDFGRSAAEDLLCKDVVQPLRVVGEQRRHASALVKAGDDFGDIHARLHIEVGKCRVRVVKAARIFLFQPVHHILHDFLGREYLIGALRRDIVKNVALVIRLKIVRKLRALFHEFLHRVIEYDLVKQMPEKEILFVTFCSVVGNTKHSTVFYISTTAFAPCSNMICFHFFLFINPLLIAVIAECTKWTI